MTVYMQAFLPCWMGAETESRKTEKSAETEPKIAKTEIATLSKKTFKLKIGTKRANFNQNWLFYVFCHEMR